MVCLGRRKGRKPMDFGMGSSGISDWMFQNMAGQSGNRIKTVDKSTLSPMMKYLSEAREKAEQKRMAEVMAQKKAYGDMAKTADADATRNGRGNAKQTGITADALRDLYFQLQSYNMGWGNW